MPRTAPLPSWALEESADELYEDAPCGYLSTAADGTVVRANGTLLRWLGRNRQDVVGRLRFADLVAAGPRVVWLTHHVPRLAAGGEVGGVLLDLVRADGGPLPVLVSARLVPSVDGVPAAVRITLLDARDRREYESTLRSARAAAERAELRARALQQVTRACAASTTTEELCDAVVEAVMAAYAASGCALRVVEGSGGAARGAEVPAAASPLGGEVVLAALEPEVDRRTGWAGSTVAHVPVRHAGRALGTLDLLLGPAAGLGPEDEPVLATLGELVGMALTRTRMYAALHRLALHDELTGLANRVSLGEVMAQALAHADRTGSPLAVLAIDLDGFKQVNDTLGHAAGDALLVACADRLRETVRDADRLARIGGDEFVVVSEDTDEEAAATVARRIAERLAEPVALPAGTAQIGASIGVAVRRPGSGTGAEALLARADAAMYADKRRRRAAGPRG